MSLIACKECGKDISSDAKNCPHCGKENKKKGSGCVTVVIILLCIMIVGAVIGEIDKGDPVYTDTPSQNSNPTPPQTNNIVDGKEALKKDDQSLSDMEVTRKNIQKKMKKYYATAEDVKALQSNVLLIIFAKETYSKSKEKTQKKLHKKASSILPKMENTLRYAFASSLEESFMQGGLDIRTSVVGKTKKILQIKYALMSNPLSYKLHNESNVGEYAKSYGFKKVIYTNGFESDFGYTWTYTL